MGTDTKIEGARAVVEQSQSAVVVVSSEQILTVIEQVHACYDYCAAWKEPAKEDDPGDKPVTEP